MRATSLDHLDATALAAQAQYRLGVCYYKKKDFAKASATFEKLVKDYPEQKDLVKLASEYLAGAVNLLPAPWENPEQLQLDVKFASGFKLGQAIYSVAAGETNGQKIWQLSSHMFAGVQQFSRVEVLGDSFKPLHSLWKHTLIGEADAVYSRGSAEVTLKGKEPKKVEFEGVLYGNTFKDPKTGYAAYIDPDSFIDHHLLVEVSKNIDGFRFSAIEYHEVGAFIGRATTARKTEEQKSNDSKKTPAGRSRVNLFRIRF